ncbi:MAG: 16S rRNA (guanine(527)-N(7))-methyltransferase RsmG [Mucinivorans sp.]
MDEIIKYFPELSARQREQFAMMQGLYTEWNSKINVISRKDIDSLYCRHVLHSLAIARTGLLVPGDRVADVGCGGGFPGIPLAVLMPSVHFTMVDSIGKKIKVVSEVSEALGLDNVTPINCRFEALDGLFDWVLSRAMTDLRSFTELTWSHTTRGILYLKGGDLEQEIRSANRRYQVFEISDWFSDEFFETKKVVYLAKK